MEFNKVSYNFGKKGWSIIGYEIIFLFFMSAITVDGLNTIVPQMAAMHGWSADLLLGISTPTQIIAQIVLLGCGIFVKRFGLKKVMVISMFLSSASILLFAYCNSVAMYAVGMTLVILFINAFAITCGFSLCANWFPTQKGVVMGITTIGMNLASALINLILTALLSHFNIAGALTVLAIVLALIAVVVCFTVKATPEEAGCYPDNDPEVAALIHKEETEIEEIGKLSYLEAFKNPKVWIIGIGYGFFSLANIGIMSQLIDFFQAEKGFSLNSALLMLTVAAVIGMIGSWLWGVVDQKIGTKKVSVAFGIWYFIGILFLIMPVKFGFIIGIIMLGGAIGGNANFPPSMASYVFGRKDFVISYSSMNMITGVVRSMSFALLAVTRYLFDGYRIPYIIFSCLCLVASAMFAVLKVEGAVGRSLKSK